MYLITGATGNIGGELVSALRAADAPVRALVRGRAVLPAGVEGVTGDLEDPTTLTGVLDGIDGVFLLPGYSALPALLDDARRTGVQHVVLLSSSAADGDPTNAVSRMMHDSEEAVRRSGITATIIRPNAFMSNTFRWLPQLRSGDVIREPFGDIPIAMTDPFDIAAVAAEVLLRPTHRGQTYRVSGPAALAAAERVAILADVLERPLIYKELPDNEARAQMSAAMPARYVDAFFRFYRGGELDESLVVPTVEQLLGRPPRTFTTWARTHAGELNG